LSITSTLTANSGRPLVLARLGIKVVETGITVERLGICMRHGNATLRNAVNEAQAALAADGTLAELIKQWLGTGATLPV
jgi:ABC-type amino acid transport substrate-binding protein